MAPFPANGHKCFHVRRVHKWPTDASRPVFGTGLTVWIVNKLAWPHRDHVRVSRELWW